MSSNIAIVEPLLVIAATALLFLLFIFAIYRFLRWLWTRLPSDIVSIEAAQLDKAVGVLLALALFPSIATYAWHVVQSLVIFVPQFMRNISNITVPASCSEGPLSSCTNRIASTVADLLSTTASSIVSALNLSDFPIADFLWFLLGALIATQLVGFLHRAAAAGTIGDWYRSALGYVPLALRERIAFTALVIGSFYLGLSALLAIPLFQDKTRADQLTADSLTKALDADIMAPDVFKTRFPEISMKIEDSSSQLTTGQNVPPSPDPFGAMMLSSLLDARQKHLQTLESNLAGIRSAAANEPANLRDQARTVFSVGIEIGGSRKQTAKHYSELIEWHRNVTQQFYISLEKCTNAVSNYGTQANQTLATARSSFLQMADFRIYTESFENDLTAFGDTNRSCQQSTSSALLSIPQRPSFADTLGPVGAYTRWLLDTEQMPVVIIVGLVGFSLLGATVSRAVRLGPDRPNAVLTLDDLMMVIAGGTTAAIVVFLAAYGGLALLGNSSGDPNPYVVFVTCLIGAVYSEDVWAWARRNVLQKATASSATPMRPRAVAPHRNPAGQAPRGP